MTPDGVRWCSHSYARHEQLHVAAGLAGPEFQTGGLLKERAQWAEQEPGARAFAEVLFGHKSERCPATHARQLVVARILTDVVHTRIMQHGRLGQP